MKKYGEKHEHVHVQYMYTSMYCSVQYNKHVHLYVHVSYFHLSCTVVLQTLTIKSTLYSTLQYGVLCLHSTVQNSMVSCVYTLQYSTVWCPVHRGAEEQTAEFDSAIFCSP